MDGFKITLILAFTFAIAIASPTRDERSLMDFGSKMVGAGIGMMGTAFFPTEESRYKCVNIMGYGFSGPDSVHPERFDGMKPEAESNGLMDSLSQGVGFLYGNTFKAFLPDTANQEICRQIGLGYHEPQPGYSQLPGGGGPPSSSNQPTGGIGSFPGVVNYLPPGLGSVSYQPGSPGSVSYQPGTQGSVTYQPGTPGSTSYQPGSPSTTIYQPGTPGSTSYQPGSPGTTTYQPGTPGTVQYQQPRPGYTVTTQGTPGYVKYTQTQGIPPGMCPCQCPT